MCMNRFFSHSFFIVTGAPYLKSITFLSNVEEYSPVIRIKKKKEKVRQNVWRSW